MTDGLSDFNIGSGNDRKFATDLIQQFRMRTTVQLKRSLNLRNIHAQRMLIQFGTSGFPGHRFNLRNREQQFFCLTADFVRLLQRDSRHGTDIYGKRALIKRRQETVSQGKEYTQCHHQQHTGASQYRLLMIQCPQQSAFVILSEPNGQKRFFRQPIFFYVPSEQVTAKYRCQRQGYQRRSKEGHDKCNAQRHQHTAFHATQEEQRYETDHNDQRRVQNRHTYLTRSLKDHFTHRKPLFHRKHPVLPQMFPYVFYVYDSIIHQ